MFHREKMIQSPLDSSSLAEFQTSIPTKKIIEAYNKAFGIKVNSYFKDIHEVKIYKCINTQYQFYYPYGIEGDSRFYETLQKISWYYVDWKWEHQKVLESISKNDKVLEVGSGNNGFVEKLSQLNYDVTGLELNVNSVNKGIKQGLKILNESIEEHSTKNQSQYDTVCSFQVMEHISNIHSFIEAKLSCLKKNGTLIISVPNNESFLKYGFNNLNVPPHHMGLWKKESLINLTNIFPIKIEKILFQPLQDYHQYYFYYNTYKYFWKFPDKLSRLLTKFSPIQLSHLYRKKFVGFTIQIHYRKL